MAYVVMERLLLKELNMRKYVVVAVIACTLVAVCASFLGYTVYKWRTSLFFGLVPEGISMSSPTEGWVVGMRERFILSRPSDTSAHAAMEQQSSDESTMALHLHNGRWSRVPVPVGLWDVFTVSENDAWASSAGDGLYHWDGTTWSKEPGTEAMGNMMSGWGGISMLSATEGWAVKWGYIWHYSDGRWIDARNRIADGTGDIQLFGLTMVSANDGWAVGLGGVIMRYDGKVWKKVESPVASRYPHQAVGLTAVSMVSSDEGWSVGTSNLDGRVKSVILHYVGGRWTLTDDDMDADLKTLAMVSPSEGWAATVTTGAVLHYHDGHWTVAHVPGDSAIQHLSMDSPEDGWALTFNGLLRYHDGVWEQYSQ